MFAKIVLGPSVPFRWLGRRRQADEKFRVTHLLINTCVVVQDVELGCCARNPNSIKCRHVLNGCAREPFVLTLDVTSGINGTDFHRSS